MGRIAGKVISIFILVIISFTANAQKYWELGGMAGGAYYLGDINHSKQFYHFNPAGGGFLRYSFTQRWQARIALNAGYLSGDDKDFANKFQQLRAHSFSTPIVETSGTIEFNFKPFKLEDRKKFFSPYVFTGGTFLIASNASNPYQIAIPMGVGLKLNFLKLFTFGVEWGFRKTFTDGLDKLTWDKTLPFTQLTDEYQLPKQTGYYRQKDWYSMVLVSLSFKLYSYDKACHTYDF
ncbi:MAG: hypothetical protein CVU05_14550 [Bacteroidetes bacterium HGW-Bacteroidetes-21]|nr:MAG: hypothetical protein CVU05_14550 [Bacteroidetes bacterium HGW-Bacteroidetes-21]